MRSKCALVYVGTLTPAADETSFASTFEAAKSVCANGKAGAGAAFGAFVNVIASEAVAFESLIAFAAKAAMSVYAFGVGITGVGAVGAFVDIATFLSITGESFVTFACKIAK